MATKARAQARVRSKKKAYEMARRKARRRLFVVTAAVIVALGAAIAVTQLATSSSNDVVDAGGIVDLYEGIPASGTTLGDPKAPVTIVEFADLQCPFCAQFSEGVLPTIVRDYVRTGQVKLVFHNISILGEQSERAARMAAAVGEQGHYWEFVDAFYANQKMENSGYVTDGFLTSVADSIPGVDGDKALAMMDSAEVDRFVEAAASEAESAGIRSTPSFFVGASGSTLRPLNPSSLSVGPFEQAIQEALSGR